jgi:actin-related protein
MYSGDETGGLVADYGSHSSKYGFAGEDCPRVVRRTRGVSFEKEFENGMLEISETLTRHDHPIIFTIPTDLSDKDKLNWIEKTLDFGAPAVFGLRSPVASAFAVGKSTTMVVEIGASKVTICPIYEGYSLLKCMRSSERLGGDYLTKLLSKSISSQLKIPNSNASSAITHQYWDKIEDMKHSCCQVYKSKAAAQSKSPPDKTRDEYVLPDGKIIKLNSIRNEICESLFDPENGMGALLYDSLSACEPDLRRQYSQDIIVVGGGSLLEGLPERLGADLAERVPHSFKPKVYATASTVERRFAPFVGCSVVASLGSFQQLWLSKKEWDEAGERVALDRFNQ